MEGEPLVVSEAQVVTRATFVAAGRLGLTSGMLADVIGLPEADVRRMESLEHVLSKGTASYERALSLLRLFRVLHAMADGDEAFAQQWLHSHNAMLGSAPADKILSESGLGEVLAHLDACRASA